MEKNRDRKFMLLLYPDNKSHVKALELIKKSYDHAYILHDKDTREDGTPDKPHWHVVITTGSNAVWNTALADNLGIEVKFTGEKVKKLDRALEYLIHFNDPDKYQYSLDEVHGNLKGRIKASINATEKTEGEKVKELLKYIDSCEDVIKVKDFAYWCADNGYWDVYRRAGAIFGQAIFEHNEEIKEKKHLPKIPKNVDIETGEILNNGN